MIGVGPPPREGTSARRAKSDLRDRFALELAPQILKSVLANSRAFKSGEEINLTVAQHAYALADAMLEAREAKP